MKYILSFILIICVSSITFAQKITINGTVKDSENVTLPGVTVVIQGTKTGASTNFDGVYSIKVPSKNAVLVFSMIGMKSQSIKVGDKKTINVILKSDVAQLEEIVVVGYGSVAKKDLTGAVVSVKSDVIGVAPTENYDQALAGRIAGVSISAKEGSPGEAMSIIIRGGNSINGDNNPLYVIDGIPLEDFDPASINAQDIESFNVLKDASATAIYGSRGANGVILIQTKKGSIFGKTKITLSESLRLSTIVDRLEVLNPYQFVKYQEQKYLAQDNWIPGAGMATFRSRWIDPELYKDVEGTSWQDEVFRVAATKNYNLSVSGGTPKTNVYFSAGYLDQEGTLINTSFEKITSALNIRQKISDKSKIEGKFSYGISKRNGPGLRPLRGNNIIKDVIRYRPVEPLGNDQTWDPNDVKEVLPYPPVNELNNTDRLRKATTLRGIAKFTHDFSNRLKFSTNLNFSSTNTVSSTFYGSGTNIGDRSERGISGNLTNVKTKTISNTNTLTYKYKKRKHNYNYLLGTEFSQYTYDYNTQDSWGYSTDQFGLNQDYAQFSAIPFYAANKSRLASFFGRVNYNYNWKYLLTVNFRADGSSKFPQGNKWGYFPSFSAGWKVSEEKFLRKVKFINSLKLRAGWGSTGNNRVGAYAYQSLLQTNPGSGYVFGENELFNQGDIQQQLAIKNLKWETTNQANFGLDFSLLNRRISGTADYYHKKTKDLLLFAELIPSVGFLWNTQNVGAISNNGFEFTVDTKNIKTDNFSWSSNINISTNKNKVLSLGNQDAIKTDAQIGWDGERHYITEVGQPVGMMYGLNFDGIYQANDFNYDSATGEYILKPGIPDNGEKVVPGEPKFIDHNGDGTISDKDRVVIGNPYPKHSGGLLNKFKYKDFNLEVLFQWSYDFDILNANKATFGVPIRSQYGGLAEMSNAWTPYNTDTNVSSISSQGAPSGNKFDDRFIEDGSFVKLRTVSLGYNLPKDVLKKIRVKSLRFTLSGQNLFTWTNYSGYDPEVNTGSRGALTQKLDYGAYPQSRTVSLGVKATF